LLLQATPDDYKSDKDKLMLRYNGEEYECRLTASVAETKDKSVKMSKKTPKTK